MQYLSLSLRTLTVQLNIVLRSNSTHAASVGALALVRPLIAS